MGSMDSDKLVWALLLAFLAFSFYRQFAGKIDPTKARSLIDAGAALIDVRSPAEFASGHLPGALNLPVGELKTRIADIGSKERPVVVYCASGMRSASAASVLRQSGFREVHDLGSMARWGG